MSHSSLTFQEPEKSWQALGLLTDEQGNTFRIFVTGSTKKDVDSFVSYQTRQQGITVAVIPIRPKAEKAESALALAEESVFPATKIKAGGVTVGISRHKMVTEPPYTITYTIDPLAPVNPPFKTEFDLEKQDVKILCTATRGEVRAELIELDTDGITEFSRISKKVIFPGSEALTARRLKSGHWRVKVVEAATSSYFTLSWDRTVT